MDDKHAIELYELLRLQTMELQQMYAVIKAVIQALSDQTAGAFRDDIHVALQDFGNRPASSQHFEQMIRVIDEKVRRLKENANL